MLIFLSLSLALFLYTPKLLYKPLPHSHDSHTNTTTQTTLRQPTTIEKLFQELPCRRHRVTKSQPLSLFPPSRSKHHTSKFHPDLHSTMQQTKNRNTQRHIHKNSDPQIGSESKQSVLKMADEVSDAPPVGEQRTTRGEQKTQKAKRKERRKN